ncbi:MAG: flagellar type III secretion system protein FlhB [Acidithiobacillus sp.]|nr:flagellar type III secretion system protein FlhB [Acidithiobacillus sp.]
MAEKEDRTEQATEKKLEEERKKGHVARSMDFAAAVVVIGVAGLLLKIAPFLGENIFINTVVSLSPPVNHRTILNRQDWYHFLMGDISSAVIFFLVIGVAAVTFAIIGDIAIGGWSYSSEKIFDVSRFSLLRGIKKPFTSQGITVLLGDIIKTVVLGSAIGILLWDQKDAWFSLLSGTSEYAIPHALETLGNDFLFFALLLLLPGTVDAILQRRIFATNMKMSKQEVKDEYKETQGNPIVRARIRSLRRKMAKMRMMKAVETATVVVTNPNHYAAAVYFTEQMDVPVLVAKGVEDVAERIKAVASAHRVPVLTAPPLARSLYKYGEIGEIIPAGLYEPVAIVLAYIDQLNRAKAGQGKPPKEWGSLDFASELGRDFEEGMLKSE